VVTINPLPTVSVNNPSVCDGQNANIIATPGLAGNYTYLWTVPVGVTNPGNVASFNTSIAGNYSVVITNSVTNCTSIIGSGVVSLNPLPTLQILSNITSGCEPLAISFSLNTTPAAVNASWNFGNSGTANSLTPQTVYINDGQYDVSVTITDVNGCGNSLSEPNYITVYPKPIIDFSFTPSTGMANEEMQFYSTYTLSPATWFWNFGDGNTQTNPTSQTTYTYSSTNNFTVTHIVETEFGCRDTVNKPIVVITKIVIPNVVTANGDGLNDTFKIDGLQYVEGASMKIYNRWGKSIYESNNYSNDWDGGNAADGVYFYILTLPDYLNTSPFSGSVTLFKQ